MRQGITGAMVGLVRLGHPERMYKPTLHWLTLSTVCVNLSRELISIASVCHCGSDSHTGWPTAGPTYAQQH
jgi:hypothetical protein